MSARPPGLPLKLKISDLLTNDTDPEADPFALTSLSLTTNNVTLQTNATHLFYTNPANVNDRFEYVVSDIYGGRATGTVFILLQTNLTGQATQITPGSNGTVTTTFAGVPGYPYQVQRATNLTFTGGLRLWNTNAPAHGLFRVFDDFSDLGAPPPAAWYRSRHNP
ncbi:MAG: Ig-like domain-containing protein [Verrucomicrobiales bacterium]|nr:Ig-like domain-containing protein [Verrucomicrobiales bacterium]